MGSDPPGRTRDDDDIVRPEDLDFTRDDRVSVLRDGCYVVSTGGSGGPNLSENNYIGDSADSHRARPDEQTAAELLDALCEKLEGVDRRHGFALAARLGGEVSHRAVLSDDLAAVFGELVTWTASHVDENTPPEAVLGILLLASGRTVRYPADALEALVVQQGLSADDSIGDLLEALVGEGVTLPADSEG